MKVSLWATTAFIFTLNGNSFLIGPAYYYGKQNLEYEAVLKCYAHSEVFNGPMGS